MPSRKKQVLDQQIPLMKDMTTKRLLIGFGYYSWQWYLIFSDGSRSDSGSRHPIDKFKETVVEPPGTKVTYCRIQYVSDSKNKWNLGLWIGIELLDSNMNLLLRAGEVEKNPPGCKYMDVYLDENDFLMGVQSSSRGEGKGLHWDMQLVFGRVHS